MYVGFAVAITSCINILVGPAITHGSGCAPIPNVRDRHVRMLRAVVTDAGRRIMASFDNGGKFAACNSGENVEATAVKSIRIS